MSDTRYIQWCPRKTCRRPFTVHAYFRNPNDLHAGRITCPYCGATINRDRNASYMTCKLKPDEEQQQFTENPERILEYSCKTSVITHAPRIF